MCLMRPVLNCYHHSYNLEKGQDAFMKYISRFLVRMIIGMACIFFLNQVFDNAGVELRLQCDQRDNNRSSGSSGCTLTVWD